MTVTYIMEARENYTSDIVSQFDSLYLCPTSQMYAGLSYDRVRRKIIYCANPVAADDQIGAPVSGTLVGGSGYGDGSHPNHYLTGGSGDGNATALITVAGGVVTGCVPDGDGLGYLIGDVLSATSLGGGSGFTFTLTAVSLGALNSTGYALWSGQTLIPNNTNYDGTLFKNHSIMVKDIATDSVTRYDAWSSSSVVPIGAGGGSPTTGTITNAGGSYVDDTYYNVPMTGGTGFGACADITVSSGIVTVVTPSGGHDYLVSDVLSPLNSYMNGAGSGAQWTVSAVTTGSDGTWRRACASSAALITGYSTINVPRFVDPRTGNVWAHHEADPPTSCEIYLLRASDNFKQIISPLQPIPGGGLHMQPLALTANYLWILNQQNGTGSSYLVGTPRTITAAETTADYLLPYPWYTWPYQDWASDSNPQWASTCCVDLSNNLYVLSWNYHFTGVTRTYTLQMFTEPSAATPYNAATVGGGFTDITPWSSSTGPNTGLPANGTVNSWLSTEVVTKTSLMYLPTSNNLVAITKVFCTDLKQTWNSTNQANTHFDCTYIDLTGGTFDYHANWLTGFLDASLVPTVLASAAWALIDYQEIDTDLNLQSYDFTSTGVDYTKRWFFLLLSPVTGGTWTHPSGGVDDSTNRTCIIQVQFVPGSPPAILQTIFDTGWNTAYAAFGTAIGKPNVVTVTAMDTLSSVNFETLDSGIWDAATQSWWWSGQTNDQFQLNPAFAGRATPGTAGGQPSPPFLVLSLGPVAPTGKGKVYMRIVKKKRGPPAKPKYAKGTAAGHGTASATTRPGALAVATAAGIGAALALGGCTASSVGAATGAGVASGAGTTASGAMAVGTAAGVGVATGAAATASGTTAVGSAIGAGLASAVGESLAKAVGTAAGAGNASASTNNSITDIVLNNGSGSSETPMWSKMFGHPFADSDATGCPLSSGHPTYPVFTIGAAIIPYSMSVNPTYWASGRLKHATFVLLLGENYTIANNATLTVTISQSSNTSLPSASSRTLADFSTADLKDILTIMDGGNAGVFTSRLNTGVSDANSDNYVWLDGHAGKMWRIREDYRNGSAVAHGALQGYHYVMSMQDSSGNFGGIRWNCCTSVPAGDAAQSLRVPYSFSAKSIYSGATLVRNNVTSGRTNTGTFTYSGSNSVMNASGNVLESWQAVRFTTTGTLPPPLVTGVTYFVYTGTYYQPPFSTFTIYSIPSLSYAEDPLSQEISPQIVITGSGSGTHTFTTYPYVSNQARIFAPGTTGEWDFVQGGGSFTPVTTYVDTNIQVQMNNTYWRKTLCVPAYDYTAPVTAGTSTPFYINTNCGLTNFPGQAGIDEHIGIMPTPFVRHLYTQSLTDERNVRATGLAGGQMPQCVRVAANGFTVPSWNNGHNGSGTPYTGMGSLLINNRYVGYFGNNGNIYQAYESSFAGAISGTTLTVQSGSVTGTIGVGQVLTSMGGTVTPGTTITGGSGLSWTVSPSQAVNIPCGMFGNGGCYFSVTEAVPGDNSHSTAYFYYPYLLTGQPEYLDMLIEKGISVGARYIGGGITNTRISTSVYAPYGTAALDGSNQGARNVAYLSVSRYCMVMLSQSIREDAWIMRDVGTLAGIIPQSYPECNAYWQYFNDIVNDNGAWVAAVIANPPTSYAATAGLFAPTDGYYIEDPWQTAYLNESCAMIYGLTGNANYLTICNAINKRVAYTVNTFGLNSISKEEYLSRQNYSSGEGPLIASDAQFGMVANNSDVTWSSSVNPTQFAFNSSGGVYTPSVNDLIFFTAPDPPAETSTPIPAALTAFQGYYIKTVSGSAPNFVLTLSATMGGSAITNTDSGSGGILVWYQPAVKLNSLDSNGVNDYPTVIGRSAYLAQSRGATLDSTAAAAIAGAIPGPSAFGATPTWCFTPTV